MINLEDERKNNLVTLGMVVRASEYFYGLYHQTRCNAWDGTLGSVIPTLTHEWVDQI
jgi:hypothetical protein